MSLKNLLSAFLRGDSNIFYPVIETRILQLNPLQITDDYETYLDISSLQDEVISQIEDTPGASYKLILNNWHFVFKKVPNSHDFYFDIKSDSYSVIETDTIVELEDFPSKMIDQSEVKYYFEARKRKEIEEMIKSNMRIKTPSKKSSVIKGGAKSTSNFGFGKASPVFSSRAKVTPSKQVYVKSPLGSRSPMGKSYYRDEVHKSPSRPNIAVTSKILTIEELLDVPYCSPPSYAVSIMPSRLTSAMATPTKNYNQDTGYDYRGSYSPYLRKRVEPENNNFPDFDEITDGLRKGLIKWNDL